MQRVIVRTAVFADHSAACTVIASKQRHVVAPRRTCRAPIVDAGPSPTVETQELVEIQVSMLRPIEQDLVMSLSSRQQANGWRFREYSPM